MTLIERIITDKMELIHKDITDKILKATNIEVGLLLNFGKKPQFVRKIFTN